MSDRTGILERVIRPSKGTFSSEHAKYVLSLSIPERDKKTFIRLSKKAQLGTLTAIERDKLDDYLSTNALLIILKSKARVSLKQHNLIS